MTATLYHFGGEPGRVSRVPGVSVFGNTLSRFPLDSSLSRGMLHLETQAERNTMGGRAGSGGAKSTSVQRLIAAAGGVRAAGNLLRAGDKIAGRLEAASAAFRGASRAQANAIATGKANARGNTAHGASVARSQRLPPVSVHVSTAGGKTRLTVTDGRHRTAAALSAGATRIRARVTYEHRGKNGRVYERSAGVQIVKL